MSFSLHPEKPLSCLIKNTINRNGPMSIAHYMSLISYHKSLGYYKNHEIGEDFITSTQISKSFGGLIALWMYGLYIKNFSEKEIILVELGPGNGDLSHSILKIFTQIPNFCDKITLFMVENSNFLASKQRKKLESFTKNLININWVEDIGLIKINKPVFFFSNEFFDCLPIHQFFCDKNRFREVLINYSKQSNKFYLCLDDKTSNYSYYLNKQDFEINHILEISPTAINITKFINTSLVSFGGISLVIDYGNLQKSGKSSLQVAYKHKKSFGSNFFIKYFLTSCKNRRNFVENLKKLSTFFQKLSTFFSSRHEVIDIFSQVIDIFRLSTQSYRHFIKILNKLSTFFRKLSTFFFIREKIVDILLKNLKKDIQCKSDINTTIQNLDYFDVSAHVDFGSMLNNLSNCENHLYTQEEFLKILNFDKIIKHQEVPVVLKNNLKVLNKFNNDTDMGKLFKVLYSKKTID